MLFRDPPSSVERCAYRYATNLALVIGPLGSIFVLFKNRLHFLVEATFAGLYGTFHKSLRASI